MTDRRPIYDAPHGSPEAGVVKVYRYFPAGTPCTFHGTDADCPLGGLNHRHMVREEDPFDSDLQAGTTLPMGPGHSWASGSPDPRVEEHGTHDEDAASWSDDTSD